MVSCGAVLKKLAMRPPLTWTRPRPPHRSRLGSRAWLGPWGPSLGPGPGLGPGLPTAWVTRNDRSLQYGIQFIHQSGPYESCGGVRTTILHRISIRIFLDGPQGCLKPLLHQKSGKSQIRTYLFTNWVHMRAMEVSGPPSDAEFRSASF